MQRVESLTDVSNLAESWRVHLEAANLSPNTIKLYLSGVRDLRTFLATAGMPTGVGDITREHIETYLVELRERTSASTAATRYRGLRQMFKWLVEEGEITRNPFERMRPPKVEERAVPVIPKADLTTLIRSLASTGFEDRRDMAIVRLFLNTGARLEEMSQLRLEVVSLQHRELYVMGKGRKGRVLPLGAKAVKDLDRYLRVRARHKEGHLPWLWLSSKGRLTSSGIAQMIKRRCKAVGIPPVHPHQFRHTFSHLWLVGGGNEHDLAKLNGWSSLQMVGRYASSAAGDRARLAHQRISPGDDI
ncbi:MAG: tyrosine-type recombinase/integrase [Actinobacteria bacterium]|nr:tyrosine-type recombinase/integrase [Actinomycetota bacterium]